MSLVSYRVIDGVCVVEMNDPPVNSLRMALRGALVEALDRAQADTAVQAIVLAGNDKAFSGGGDIREFTEGGVDTEPTLPSVIEVLDNCRKPVVAAVSGLCLGGGLELALGCHFRVAARDAQVGLPEVKLGLLPGAGGTQRLPRLIGPEAALNLIVSGGQQRADAFEGTPLFDAYAEGSPVAAAVDFARAVVAERRPLQRVRDLRVEFPNHEAFFQFARNTIKAVAKQYPAPLQCVEAVAAAVTKPFGAGLAIETAAFMHLIATPESKALRHAFFAERASGKLADVPEDTPRRTIGSVAVIGAGTMGGGIAMTFANAGIPVLLLEQRAEALEKGLATIRKHYESSAKKGKLSPEKLQARLALVRGTLKYEDLADADLVIEAVFEDMQVKQAVFGALDGVMKPGAILATNTSTLDVDRIAGFTRRPQDVVGLHFFSPANVMPLLEIVRGKATAKDVLATVLALARKIRKTPVVSGVCYGFIGNRMMSRYQEQAVAMLEEGALPQQIDRALEKWGMAMGPLRMSDLSGNDVSWLIRKHHFADRPEEAANWRLADLLCERGRFGQKTGAGWYRYESGKREPQPDAEVEQLITEYSQSLGLKRRKFSDEEIVRRCILALVNEGARILEEGIAQRASDLDLVYLTGYGFPAFRGGPMLWADGLGLFNVARLMRGYAAAARTATVAQAWQPAPLVQRLVAEGKSFN
ncbi:MAG TPA: 3-hydroxyacyl-CoA dehydrogenase NAD-binding domain-containing protein [Burkholderiaceae bacterium]|nr:3-hydroxyacyl-CoA dehydrogenase NAD-binding domain-containing protein [Burkholderiaceae bacterium]